MQRGRTDHLGATADDLRESLSGKLGDGNFQRRAISWGRVESGEDAGKMDAVYASLTLIDTVNVYTVRHALRRKPGFAVLWTSENTTTPASHYSVIPWDRKKWTESTLQVRVEALVGNLAGGALTLLVGGE